MTATRSRREEKHYASSRRHSTPKKCPFCGITANDEHFVEEGKAHQVIRNIFPYSLWDGQGVVDHLMVIPKKHTNTLSSLTGEEKAEYVDLISKYEAKGYGIYARPPQSVAKSVVHQHTHLIKLDGKQRRFVFLLRKPYIRLVSHR